MSDTPHTRYRPDIDGLRAVAVLAVIAFHVGLPGVSGGFVGVDVFFVISGYLITGLLLNEAERHGRVALPAFFARRVRRLMPALVTVLVATFLLSAWLMFPQELPRLGKSGMSVALISSNIHFLKYSGGYFDPSTDLMPLLHTWSLAVEEQYYLVWPLLFVAVGLWSKRRTGNFASSSVQAMLWIVLAVSFALNVAFVGQSKSAVFYLMPFRAWEFALGGLLNYHRLRLTHASRATGEALFYGGSAAVLGTVFLLTDRMPFPGAVAAIPAVGTAAIIAGGTVATARWPRRILGSRVMVGIGLLSYSWYLWHWPLIALNRSHNLGTRSLTGDGLVALVALLLAWATYRAIEVPIRFRKPWLFSGTRSTLWLGVAMSLALLATAAAVIEYGKHASARFVRPTGAAAAEDDEFRLAKCTPNETERALDAIADCSLGATTATAIVAWGDSHVEHWKPLLGEAAQRLDMRVVMRTLNTCPPLLGAVPYKRTEGLYGCGYNNDNVMNEVRHLAETGQVRGVVLGARWNEYLALQETDPAAMLAWALADDWTALERQGGGNRAVGEAPYDHDGSAATEARALRRTLAALAQARLRVLIVAPVPELYFNGPQCLYLRSADACVVPRAKVAERRRSAIAAIETAAAGMDNVRIWDPIDEFCDDRLCYAQRDGVVMYSDHNHVSPAKAKALLPKLAPHLDWLKG